MEHRKETNEEKSGEVKEGNGNISNSHGGILESHILIGILIGTLTHNVCFCFLFLVGFLN